MISDLFVLHSCVSGAADKKHQNIVDLFGEINPKVSVTYNVENAPCSFKTYPKPFIISFSMQESKHTRTDRLVLCCLRKAQPGISWPRLTKLKEKVIVSF